MVRVDAGKLSWFQSSGTNVFANVTGIALGQDESVWIIGVTNLVFVRRHDQYGNTLSGFTVGTNQFLPNAIAINSVGQVFLSGFFHSNVYLGTTNLSYVGHAFFVAGLESSGKVFWASLETQPYGTPITAIACTAGGIVTVGWYDLQEGYGLITKRSDDGVTIWRKEHRGHRKSLYRASNLAVDSRGWVHVIGNATRQFTSGVYRRPVWLLTLDADGQQRSEQFILSGELYVGNSGSSIAVNNEGDIFISGKLEGSPIFGTNVMGAGTSYPANGFVARRATVQPKLRVSRTADNVVLHWPQTALPFALQQANAFGSNEWSDVEFAPQQSGRDSRVSVSREAPHRFFRLNLTNEIPIRHPPLIWYMSVSLSSSPFSDTTFFTTSNTVSSLVFVGYAEDIDANGLLFTWFDGQTGQRLTNGVSIAEDIYSDVHPRYRATMTDPALAFAIGTQTVSLVVFDGSFFATNSVGFRVLSVSAGIDELNAAVSAEATDSEALLVYLEAAHQAVDGGHFNAAIERLQEFRAGVEGRIDVPASTRERFKWSAQKIIAGIPQNP